MTDIAPLIIFFFGIVWHNLFKSQVHNQIDENAMN